MQVAILLHEESQRLLRMCRELRNKHALIQVLHRAKEQTSSAFSDVEEEDDFNLILDPPHIHGKI